jgi:hypothetical protein
MWDIAVKYADVVIFTDDDPDTENRLSILNQLSKTIQEKWYSNKKKVFIIPERKYALHFATEIAKNWDVVVSCGKWHEQVQITNFWKRKWNDKQVLSEILTSQKKLILNSKEIKKAYLQNLRYEKSQNHITTKEYYSNPQPNPTPIDNNKPSWMFKPID